MEAILYRDIWWRKVTYRLSVTFLATLCQHASLHPSATHWWQGRRNSLCATFPEGYEKFPPEDEYQLQQADSCSVDFRPILISLFYLPPWMQAEGLTIEYFPRDYFCQLDLLLPVSWIVCYWLLCEFQDYMFISIIMFVCILLWTVDSNCLPQISLGGGRLRQFFLCSSFSHSGISSVLETLSQHAYLDPYLPLIINSSQCNKHFKENLSPTQTKPEY